jgi:hypothetical protein
VTLPDGWNDRIDALVLVFGVGCMSMRLDVGSGRGWKLVLFVVVVVVTPISPAKSVP